jgi:hypothetical protein
LDNHSLQKSFLAGFYSVCGKRGYHTKEQHDIIHILVKHMAPALRQTEGGNVGTGKKVGRPCWPHGNICKLHHGKLIPVKTQSIPQNYKCKQLLALAH